ncbi:MAG: hypothetical protein WBA63_02430 [Thermomicrobiales bacterium]
MNISVRTNWDTRDLVLAVVDIGTNTLKFTVASCRRDGTITLIAERAETVRLGAGIEAIWRIDENRAVRAISALREFESIATDAGAVSFSGVATEALRLATNGSDILARITAETRWQVRVISGDEEARLTFVGLRPLLPASGRSCIVDIGGGSTEWITAEHAEIVSSQSIPLGSGRLADRLFTDDPPRDDALASARHAAATTLDQRVHGGANTCSTLLLSGGNGQFLERLRTHLGIGSALDRSSIDEVLAYLARTPARQVADILDIAEERARVFPAGVAIAAAVTDRLAPTSIMAVPSGIRTGLLLEKAREIFDGTPSS